MIDRTPHSWIRVCVLCVLLTAAWAWASEHGDSPAPADWAARQGLSTGDPKHADQPRDLPNARATADPSSQHTTTVVATIVLLAMGVMLPLVAWWLDSRPRRSLRKRAARERTPGRRQDAA
jgi:hypothetical protein